ncbi:GlxA family transcriptional regulator, partial [Ochrobactrum sp. GRS2]|nr:GlxA family transcriptional regulator [Ochrobactrum sp. GRS2]
VVPPHILLLDVAGPVEVLRRANAEQQDILFDYHFVSTQTEQVSSIGLAVAGLEPLPPQLPDDAYILVCGAITAPAEAIDPE